MDVWRRKLKALMDQNEDNDMDETEEEVIWEILMEDYDQIPAVKRGGSRPGKRPNVNRDRKAGAEQIFRDYFALNSTYDDRLFRRRFRMRRVLFNRLVAGVASTDDYFLQKRDALGVSGLSTLQKVVAAHRQICYGSAADSLDEYVRIGESTALQCLTRFCAAVVKNFGSEYLREPTKTDIERWLEINKHRGFPGMFGSLDWTHWVWKSCPVSWQGQYQDRKGQRSIILEAVCTKDLWIWHWYFGLPGSNNDINVVDRSPLLLNMLRGHSPQVEYTVINNEYKMAYLLTDGIYPNYHCFMKTIREHKGKKDNIMQKCKKQ